MQVNRESKENILSAKKMIADKKRKIQINDDLKTKVEYEFDIFYLTMTATTKENIFAQSREIEMKRTIRNYLIGMVDRLSDDEKYQLMFMENLLENSYRFCSDKQMSHAYPGLDQTLKLWLNFVQGSSGTLRS